MLWLVPQGVVMSMGYVMFSIPGLEFAYAEAPSTMKTIIMAGWLLTLAAGNLVVVIVQAIVTFDKAVSVKQCNRRAKSTIFLFFSPTTSSCTLD